MSGEFYKKILQLLIICCFLSGNISLAQVLFPDREDKLERLKTHSGIKTVEIEPGIFQITFSDGHSLIKNVNDLKTYTHKLNYSPNFDSTLINLITLDTIPFYRKYSYWQELNVGTDNTKPPLVTDINNNGRPEIYGQIKSYASENSDNIIMEKNTQGSFDSVYSYDSTSIARAAYDINRDGYTEVLLHRFPPDTNFQGMQWPIFSQTSDTSLATELSLIFYPFDTYNNQLNNNTFGDWDGDDITDQIFIRHFPMSFYVYEFDTLNNNFDSVYFYDLSQNGLYFAGFAIGDFNQNGKTEFWEGGVNGEVEVIENCGDNCYRPIYSGFVETNNAYLYAATNDIDGNGKPEVWIGGDYFDNGIGYTRIIIFEADGENNYVKVGKVDFIGVFSFNASNMQVLDVDKDGKQEIMICIDGHVIILKFTGSVNHQKYSVFFMKRNDIEVMGGYSDFYGATMYDVTGDGKEDIVVHMDEFANGGMRLFTNIYKADFTVNIEERTNPDLNFVLFQNYPNPFNPSTSIKFTIPEYSYVNLKVYNILGKEITTLLDKELSPGSFTIDWAAKGCNGQLLPSGIYLIRIQAAGEKNYYLNTIKTVLVK